jgi:hypothetical protein
MRLTLSRCRYVTLSVEDVPPNVPQPSVMEQSSPVVIPQHPCAPAAFTRIRPTGMRRAKRSTRGQIRAVNDRGVAGARTLHERPGQPQPSVLTGHRKDR